MNAALAADDGSPLADGSRSVRVAVALVAAMFGDGGLEGIVANTATVMQAGPPEVNPWWAMAVCIRATALLHLGRYDDARTGFLDALPELHQLPGFEAGTLVYLALLHLRAGDLIGAREYADAGRRVADSQDLADLVPMLIIYAGDALVAARTGQRERAHEASRIATASLERLGRLSPRTRIYTQLILAQAHHALLDGAGARRRAGDAARTLLQHPISGEFERMLAETEELLAGGLLGSDLAITPLTVAERRLLPYLPTHLSLTQIAGELNVSRNTVKSHCLAVYRKLGVSSRTAAVAEGRRQGLIET